MIPYNASNDPPAPFVAVQISPVSRDVPSISVDGLLDTGADVSLIPQRLVAELKLAPEDTLIIEGYDGER